MIRTTLAAALAAAALAAPAAAQDAEDDAARSVYEVIVEADEFQKLAEAVRDADLGRRLDREGPFTVFAPVDDAFERVAHGAADMFGPWDYDDVDEALAFHVVPGRVAAEDLRGETQLTTIGGGTLQVDGPADDDPKGTFVQGATVLDADIEATNGVIHAVNAVLEPRPR